MQPNKYINLGKNTIQIIDKIIELIVDITIPFPTPLAAFSFLFSPNFTI